MKQLETNLDDMTPETPMCRNDFWRQVRRMFGISRLL